MRALGLAPVAKRGFAVRNQPVAGTKVRLTSAFLRSTGQHTGDEPRKRWVVQACFCGMCITGRFVAVDEPSATEDGAVRHIAVAHLEPAR
jgi:hypothetical protein